ncbi:MAG: DNA primase [bacterium]|nr:DNA primase [bacterium]
MSSHVEQIKSRLGIADVVQGYLKLQKAGANFRALCPFHNEKTPSFFVSPGRESWHCFGCNRGGDIFSFVMEIEGLEFPEALKILASRAGVELKPVSSQYRSERSRLLSLLENAKMFYESNLKNNDTVISYLKSRGLKGETAKAFGIGFAPDGWRNLHDFLKAKGFSGEEMEKAGMALQPQTSSAAADKSQKYYDRFRSRIMFPLNNSSGQIVGFSGRIFSIANNLEIESPSGLGDSISKPVVAKYINTPQTILYDKSRTLYGFDKAKMEIRKKDACVLMEGQMDVIMAHQAGFANTVAISGTALTEEHLRIIKRLTNNLIMAFDSDEAGFRASKRGIDMALAEGFEVKAAEVPLGGSGKDPADIIKENPDEWKKAVENSEHIISFYLRNLSDRKEIERMILPYIALLPSDMEKAHWVKKTAEKLSISEEPIWGEVKKIKLSPAAGMPSPQPPAAKAGKTRMRLLEDRLLGFILWQKDSEDGELKEEIEKISKEHNFDPDKVSASSGGAEEKLVFEAELFYNETEDLKGELDKLNLEFKKEKTRNRLEELGERIRGTESSQNEEKLKDYMDEFHILTKKLTDLSRSDR